MKKPRHGKKMKIPQKRTKNQDNSDLVYIFEKNIYNTQEKIDYTKKMKKYNRIKQLLYAFPLGGTRYS